MASMSLLQGLNAASAATVMQSKLRSEIHGVSLISSSFSSPPHGSRSYIRPVRASQEPTDNLQEDRPQAEHPQKVVTTKTSFSDVFAFAGPAPETINGRLAMVGFVTALAVEAATGHDLIAQIQDGGGLKWLVVSGLVVSGASLIPIFKGVSAVSRSGSIMSAQAETWNGRAAMLGLVALVLTEYFKQGPLIS